MKKKTDPRHILRVQSVKKLFELTFKKGEKAEQDSLAQKVLKSQKEIDKLIKKHAPAWPLEQIAPIDLVTLRLAIWELIYSDKKEPYKVIIDEAVEIAKEFGSESSGSFVNGVLGTIVKSTNLEAKND